MLPLVLPLSEDSLRLLKDDKRKVVVTIMKDEVDEKSYQLIKVLKAAASANRDLIFGYVGLKQWEDFVESFEVYKKTPLPKMVVWDGNDEYHTVSDGFSFYKNFLEFFYHLFDFSGFSNGFSFNDSFLRIILFVTRSVQLEYVFFTIMMLFRI